MLLASQPVVPGFHLLCMCTVGFDDCQRRSITHRGAYRADNSVQFWWVPSGVMGFLFSCAPNSM